MAASTVTYEYKDDTQPIGTPKHQVRDDDLNELKDVANNHAGLIDAIDSLISDVLAGAPGSYNTFLEIGNKLTSLDSLKAPIDNPTFTGTVSGIAKSMVGLGNVDNTSDATKNSATATLTNKTLTSPI